MKTGDKVKKVGGDYQFEGVIVSSFTKKSGALRFAVEDDRGVLHIYSEKNLEPASEKSKNEILKIDEIWDVLEDHEKKIHARILVQEIERLQKELDEIRAIQCFALDRDYYKKFQLLRAEHEMLSEACRIISEMDVPPNDEELAQNAFIALTLVKARLYGYVCPLCGEPINDSQPTGHSENGICHQECLNHQTNLNKLQV